MLGNFGMTELLVIFGIALLLFGNRLPGVGKSLGQSIRAFKKGMNEDEAEASPSEEKKPESRPLSQSRSRENVIDIKVDEKQ